MTTGLVIAWTEFGRRTAVIAGMGIALVSLIQDCPLWVASVRGAATIAVVALIAHTIARLLQWSTTGDREENLARLAASKERK